MAERRSGRRISARIKIWCEAEQFTLLAETVDVSERGMFVRTAGQALDSGPVRLTIQSLGMVAEAEVRWLRTAEAGRSGMGLQILDFERGSQAYQRFVQRTRTPSTSFKAVSDADLDKDKPDHEA